MKVEMVFERLLSSLSKKHGVTNGFIFHRVQNPRGYLRKVFLLKGRGQG